MIRPKEKVPTVASFPDTLLLSALDLNRCLAKTRPLPDGTMQAGRTVEEHCRIVAAVALGLLQRMPQSQRNLFPERVELSAAAHDVGKVCPTFQEKIYRAAGYPVHHLPELHGADPNLEKLWGGHAAVSMAALLGCGAAKSIAAIAGQHHGFTPQWNPPDCAGYGGNIWQERRRELLCRLLAGDPASPEVWPDIRTPAQARLVAGLTTVADWIGSGERFDDPALPWEPLVDEATSAAGFTPLRVRPGLTFEDVFPFAPLEIQRLFFEQVTAPGVYVLEAPMGAGKTEAALYAAYGMLQQGQSSGIYFALPTQLTSNRIHTRLNAFLDRILEPATPHRQAQLLHGKAWLARFLQQEMGEDAAPHGSWFQEGKRGILAPFAAGTVDQALMAAMHVRHGAVRAYGLAGKTVILDEVHSYDAYTGVILDALVSLLRQYGCTVLILSATLTGTRRAAFTGAATESKEPAKSAEQTAYPLVSVSTVEGHCRELHCPPLSTATVSLVHVPEDASAEEEVLLRAEQGQQVLWIENTVADAQEKYRLFAARTADMDVETGLVHSRFTPADRHVHEGYWTGLFGKDAVERKARGRVLVGTQVLEQSLDIDADFLVTRFCPTDMLLQRLGRLWRHSSPLRPSGARREAWLLHPALSDVQAQPEDAWGATGRVYMPYVLFRSLEQWEQRTAVCLPQDIRGLLEATYADRIESCESIQRTVRALNGERETLRGLALRGISTDAVTSSEEKASTRAGQRPQADVLLLRSFNRETGTATLADGTRLDISPRGRSGWAQRQEYAARLTLNSVRVPEYKAPAPLSLQLLDWLRPWVYCGADTRTGLAALRVAVIRPDDSLQNLHGAGLKSMWYRKDYGYMTT